MKSAKAYLRKGDYYVHPLAASQGGIPSLFSGPVLKLTGTVAPRELGEAVNRALDQSRPDVPWPKVWTGLSQPLYDAAGVKNETTFRKGLKAVRIDLAAGSISILPTTSGAGKGNRPLMDQQVSLASSNPDALGAAVLEALSLSD